MQENSNLSVLVIDPNPGMRSNLQNMLNASSISKVEYAVNSGTAIRQLTRRAYDIILCEYDLGSGAGDGQDGQQLLEDLPHHRLIAPWAIFIMLTSDAVHAHVVSAAELTHTHYVVNPFTAENTGARLPSAVEARPVMLPDWHLVAHP